MPTLCKRQRDSLPRIQFSTASIRATGVANATNGVMNLSSGGASGIGIQLTDISSNPIQFNTATPSGLTLNQTSSATTTINLQARYYQTGTSVTAGAANATATVTLTICDDGDGHET